MSEVFDHSHNLHRVIEFLLWVGFSTNTHDPPDTYSIIATEGEEAGDILYYKIDRVSFDSVTLEYWGIPSSGKYYDYIHREEKIEMDENLNNLTNHFIKRTVFKTIMREKKLKELGI